MSSRSLFKSVLALFLFAPLTAFAGVSIAEIMYDAPGSDSGREWIEIHNTDSVPVDAAGWKLFESGVNHKIVPQKGSSIPGGGYAVIAVSPEKFLADWPGYAGVLFQSSFSLKNTGETLSLKNASSTELASVAYPGGAADGDGNSLNLANSAWVARKPTPGAEVSPEKVLPPAPKQASQSGNVSRSAKVSKGDGAAYDGAVAISDSSNLAAVGNAEKGNSESFAMLPWIAALFAVIAIAGAAIFLKGKTSSTGSGYTIIEEK